MLSFDLDFRGPTQVFRFLLGWGFLGRLQEGKLFCMDYSCIYCARVIGHWNCCTHECVHSPIPAGQANPMTTGQDRARPKQQSRCFQPSLADRIGCQPLKTPESCRHWPKQSWISQHLQGMADALQESRNSLPMWIPCPCDDSCDDMDIHTHTAWISIPAVCLWMSISAQKRKGNTRSAIK
mgnify:CR=1 FL=1